MHTGQQPQLPDPLLQGPPSSAFHLQPPDLATVRMDISVMFRVKAEAVPSCRIQSVRRPVNNGMAISPGEEKEGGISHKYQISLSRSVPSRLPSLPHPTLSNPHPYPGGRWQQEDTEDPALHLNPGTHNPEPHQTFRGLHRKTRGHRVCCPEERTCPRRLVKQRLEQHWSPGLLTPSQSRALSLTLE